MASQIQGGQAGGSPNSVAGDPELLGDFILESREHLAAVERELLILEQDPANAEAIHSIFRGFHTIKGLAGFLELASVGEVAHEVETILDLARNRKLAVTPPVIDCILESKDYLGVCVSAIESMLLTGIEPPVPGNENLIEAIRCLTGAQASMGLQALSKTLSEAQTAGPSGPAAPAESALIKVDTAKLDFLVDMVGELVLAQSLLQHHPDLGGASRARLTSNLSQLARITGQIQKTAMAMRMVPVKQLFQKMSRLVRDLSKKAGKLVEIEAIGEETEIDRHIVEELADPIMHMVRNSIDHGIEPPDQRTLAGKPASATLGLKARYQGGHILIQVEDDGRGLDRDKILAKARKNGIVEQGAEPTEQEIFGLIFQPGFSTAEHVTEVSGRGVGMDVVRKHILKLRGRIDIRSEKGRGTTFFIRVPLTLAIIDGLVASVGSERYIVPIYAVRELVRPTEGMISSVEGRREMALIRGSLLPVVRLCDKFGVKPRSTNPLECLLIVAETDEKRFGLLVDGLVGKQEVVIKSLGPTLQDIAGVSGGAILGDGRVGLILDMEGLYGGEALGG